MFQFLAPYGIAKRKERLPVQGDLTNEGFPIHIPPFEAYFCDYFAAPLEGSAFHPSPGAPTNTGGYYDPWDLQTALTKTSQLNGKVLGLLPTTDGIGSPHVPYRGKFKCNLTNATIMGVAIRGSGRPRIDGYVYATLSANMVAGGAGSLITFAVDDATELKRMYDAGAINTVIIDGEAFFLSDGTISGNNITARRAAAGSEPANTSPAHPAGSLVRAAGNQLWINANNVTVKNLEIMNSDPRRDWRYDGGEGLRGVGVFVPDVSGTKIVHCNIHDNLSGIFTGSTSSNTEIYGNRIINNGMYDGTNDGKGHGLYLENPTGFSRVYNNIIVNNFGLGTQMYGRTAVYAGGDAQGNFWANNGSPLGAGIRHQNLVVGPETQPLTDVNIQGNYLCHLHNANAYNMKLGYGAGAANGHVLDNYFIGGTAIGLEIVNTTSVTVTGNKFFSTGNNSINIQTGKSGLYQINNNQYYATAANADKFGNITDHANQTFAVWKQSTGYDSTSTAVSTALPQTVVIKPSAYETGRAHIYVLAPTASAVSIDLANTGFPVGKQYEIRNAFDFNGTVVASGTYNGGSQIVSIPLTSAAALAVQSPVGGGYTPATTLPAFGAFILIDLGL